MADVSSNDRKIKLTKNGKVVKRRSRNPEGQYDDCTLKIIGNLLTLIILTLLSTSLICAFRNVPFLTLITFLTRKSKT